MALTQAEIVAARQKYGVPTEGFGANPSASADSSAGGAPGGSNWFSDVQNQWQASAPQAPAGPKLGEGAAGDFSENAVRSVVSPLVRTGGLIEKGLDQTLGRGINMLTGKGNTPTTSGADAEKEAGAIDAGGSDSLAGHIGTAAGSILPYFTGVGEEEAAARAATMVPKLAEHLGLDSSSFIPKVAGYLARKAPIAVRDTAIGTAQTGDLKEGALIGATAPIAEGVLKTIPKVATGTGLVGKGLRRVADYADDKRELSELPAVVQQAIKTDIPAPYAKMISDATPEEKMAAEKMLDMQVKGVEDMSSKARPEGVIGARILQAVKAVAGLNKQAGEAEGAHVGDLATHLIDHSKTTDSFLDSLHSLNVKVDPEDGRLDFSNSEFKGPSNSKDRGLFQSVWDELQPGAEGATVKNARDLHTGRQALFNELKGRPTMDPFAPKAVSIAESARKGLLADIAKGAGQVGAGYKKQTTNFAVTHKALEDFYNLLGKKWTGRPEDLQSLKAGEVFNRIKGNAAADSQYVLDNIEKLAAQGGFKSKIDPQKLIDINQLIKEIVGDTQSASLSGGVKRGVADAMGAAGHVASAATGSIPGLVKGAIEFAQGNTKPEQIRALRKLLSVEPF